MENLCRICMEETQDLISMVKETSENEIEILKAGNMFENCFGLEIIDVSYCYKICMDCKIQLTYFYEFKQRAIQSHKKLLKLVESTSINDIETELNDVNNDCDNASDDYIIEFLGRDEELLLKSGLSSIMSDDDQRDNIKIEIRPDMSNDYSNDNSYVYDDGEEETILEDEKTIKKKSRYKYRCEMCDKNFRNQEIFTAHMNVHKGLPAYRCEICGKHFKFKVNYSYHMRNHNNHRSFLCSTCNKTFLCKWDLKLHKRVHDDIRPFVCDICGKKFRVRSHMTDHKETHNDQNTYECQICFQKYKTKATLKMHMSTIHDNTKSYCCPKCDKIFKRKYHLKIHLHVHETNEVACHDDTETLDS